MNDFNSRGRSRTQAANAVIDLFTKHSGMQVDLTLNKNFSSYTTSANLLTTQDSLLAVLSSQSTPFTDLPFMEKIWTAVDSIGWPAEAFTTLLHHSDPSMVAIASNDRGKTALHWAAAHFGTWRKEFYTGSRLLMLPVLDSANAQRIVANKAESYELLISDLTKRGADVYTLWHDAPLPSGANKSYVKSPFLSFLDGLNKYHSWDFQSLADAICRWGQIITISGQSLREYTATENRFLSSDHCIDTYYTEGNGRKYQNFTPVKLVVSKAPTLALHIADVTTIPVWVSVSANIPGAWPASSRLPSSIIWTPDTEDEQHGFKWASAPEVTKLSISYLVGSKPPPCDSLLATTALDWDQRGRRQRFDRSQDDNDQVAILMARELQLVRRARESGRRRTASNPPARIYKFEAIRDDIPFSSIAPIHKCPLDSRWSVYTDVERPTIEYWPVQWRKCMRGDCHKWTGHSYPRQRYRDWEDWLLRNEDLIPAARRFAKRFCPDFMWMVEETSQRATERAQLAMGPMRPP